MGHSNRPKICIVAHSAFGALSGGTTGHIGGVEWQTSLTARWLGAQGWRVSMLTWDEGPLGDTEVEGVRVIKMCRRAAGIPGLRFFLPRWTSLNRAMRRADADLYYQNCGECVTGQVALWCRRNRRAFVYSIANDPDVDPSLPDMHTMRERVLYRYGLRRADRIIVQTRTQADTLRKGFGLDSVVLPMPCPGPTEDDYVAPVAPTDNSKRIVWVARVCEQKRPDRFLDIADACQDLRFDFVGPSDDSPYCQRICERARRISNLVLHGGVSRSKLAEFYRRAACLCCTSDFEGFPNTFLEAWSHGLPIVSTFDPDGLIGSRDLGAVASDVPGLINEMRKLTTSPIRWRRASQNARRYYVENHAVENVLPRFERVFLAVCGRERGIATEIE